MCSLGRLCSYEMLLFVDSAGEGSEETAVQNECHATNAHRGGASVGPHEHISTAGVFNFFHLVCPASSGLSSSSSCSSSYTILHQFNFRVLSVPL